MMISANHDCTLTFLILLVVVCNMVRLFEDFNRSRQLQFMRGFVVKRVHLDTATVVASAVPSRWARCTELAGDSQRYNAHPFSDGGSVQMYPARRLEPSRQRIRPIKPALHSAASPRPKIPPHLGPLPRRGEEIERVSSARW